MVAAAETEAAPATTPPPAPRRLVSFREADVEEGRHSGHRLSISEVSMRKIVNGLYARVLSDPLLAPFYDVIDLTQLKLHQERVMMIAFGGMELVQAEAPDLDMRRIHWRHLSSSHCPLSLQHWEAFLGHFEDTVNSMPEIPEVGWGGEE